MAVGYLDQCPLIDQACNRIVGKTAGEKPLAGKNKRYCGITVPLRVIGYPLKVNSKLS